MVGLDARSTMDLDATIKGANVNVEDVENMMAEIIAVPIDDGVTFQVKSISEKIQTFGFFTSQLRQPALHKRRQSERNPGMAESQ